jgi:acetolactate synthase-1/2/3 large subunit
MMNSQELETAIRLGLDLVVMILRDDGYGMIRWKQEAMGFKDFGLSFKNPDFVAYAAAYGAHGVRVERTEDLLPTLQASLRSPGVHVIDVPIDYSENRIFTRELEQSGT